MNDPRHPSSYDRAGVYDIVCRHAAIRPEAEALVEGSLRLSFGAVKQRVDALGRALMASGVSHGDRVCVVAPPGIMFFELFLATASIGAAWCGGNPRYKAGEFEHLLADVDPALVVVQSPFDGRDYAAELKAIDEPQQFVVFAGPGDLDDAQWDTFLARSAAISDEQHQQAIAGVQTEDVAQLVYTSGTTGRPKGAMLSQRAVVWCALSSVVWMGDALATTIMCAPISHVGGLNFVCMNVFTYGGKLVFHERVDMAVLAQLTAQELPTYLVAGPTAFAVLLAMPGFDPRAFFGIYKLITFGGAPTPEEVLKVIGHSGARMATIYGRTETTSCAAASPEGVPLEVMASTIGRELDGVQIRIASAEGHGLPIGEVGEIQVKGPCVMSGYHRNEQATREAFTADGFLKTGDLGQRRTDGFIVVVGRLKEMFKSGGYNICPLEVENAINQPAAGAVHENLGPDRSAVGHGARGAARVSGDEPARQVARADHSGRGPGLAPGGLAPAARHVLPGVRCRWRPHRDLGRARQGPAPAARLCAGQRWGNRKRPGQPGRHAQPDGARLHPHVRPCGIQVGRAVACRYRPPDDLRRFCAQPHLRPRRPGLCAGG